MIGCLTQVPAQAAQRQGTRACRPAGMLRSSGHISECAHSSLRSARPRACIQGPVDITQRDRWRGGQWGLDRWRGGQWGRDMWRGGQWGRNRWRGDQWGRDRWRGGQWGRDR